MSYELRPLIVTVTNRGLSDETRTSIDVCGYPSQLFKGMSCVALARNVALTDSVTLAEKHDINTIVFVDDDMVFSKQQMDDICALSLQYDYTVSALYLQKDGSAAMSVHKDAVEWHERRWLTGLGFIAFPTKALLKLRDESEMARFNDDEICCYTEAARGEDGMWRSEDFTLTHRLGGVMVAPIGVGHLKTVTLKPDQKSLGVILSGTPKAAE